MRNREKAHASIMHDENALCIPHRKKLDVNMSTNLPVLNYDFALSQLGGNEALLKKMLGRFVSEFVGIPADVAALLAENDISAAKMKVHTIKGISGNLGLQALYDCATRFDAELRTGELNQSMLEEFTYLVGQTCCEINKMELKETPQKSPERGTMSADESKIALISRLNRNEFIDDDTLNELIGGLALDEAETQKLVSLIEELQYPEAIALIEGNDHK